MALKLRLQDYESLERKRSKSRENFGVDIVDREAPPTPDVKNQLTRVESVMGVDSKSLGDDSKREGVIVAKGADKSGPSVIELSAIEANKLFLMIFGDKASKNVLAQWSNQDIRFSADNETSMGLRKHEAGPCVVLAAIQEADFLKDEVTTPIKKVKDTRVDGERPNIVKSLDFEEDCVGSNSVKNYGTKKVYMRKFVVQDEEGDEDEEGDMRKKQVADEGAFPIFCFLKTYYLFE
ncbi:hypothetical protein CASFOL_004684 [Castilleja foliolosa]|uniref:Uncharacterized protein n=1 Tax=Castilleja foliolosa TaxID=1961234 RepID=A0ABD3ED74_9LAMI